ncbi:MAG: hypothetical protein EA379_07580 [Phycisphaerales bacterium]|nr:MAG: hypothetical protein EA379_07580 [Phycisphaerales bacterium]
MRTASFAIVAGLATALTANAGGVLFDNGGMITHPGAGAGGLNVSMASPGALNLAGSNVRQIPGDPGFRMADDFTVSGNWIVNSITVFAYETNAAVPTWTGANMNIWSGRPGDAGSAILDTFMAPTVAQTDIYRVFNGLANLTNTQRRVNSLTFDLGGMNLGAGTYWIDWQVIGNGSGWAPFVMLPDPTGGAATTTVLGNGRQMTNLGVWQDIAGVDGPLELPFIVTGIPSPGAAALLGIAGLVGARRRR